MPEAEHFFGISQFELFHLAILGEISLSIQVPDGLTVYNVDPSVLQTQALAYALPQVRPSSVVPAGSVGEKPFHARKLIQFVALSSAVCGEIRNNPSALIPQSMFSHGYSTEALDFWDPDILFEKVLPESAELKQPTPSTSLRCLALYPSDMKPLSDSPVGYPAPIVIHIGYQHLCVMEAEALRAKVFLSSGVVRQNAGIQQEQGGQYEAEAPRQEEKTLKAEKLAEPALLPEPLETIQPAPIEPRPSSAKKFLRIRELMSRLGVSRATIYTRLDPKLKYYDETFPKKFKANGVVVWDEREVDEWMEVQRKKGKDGQ